MKFSKLANSLTASATMAATLKAQDLKSKGVTLVVGTVGEPHEPVDAEIKNALTNYLNTKPSRYVSAQGLLDTRLALSDWFHQVYQTKYTPEQIVITPGSKFGLYALLQLLCDADDEVIIPTPYWVSYITQAQLAKAKPVICNTDETYKLNATLLRGAITKHSRLLILNSPNNPSGAVYTKNELHSLYLVLKEHPQITVLCDDIYNQLIFTPDERAPSLLDVADEDFKKNQLIIVHGVSKSYAMTGWRLGWIAADKECIEKLTSFISQTLTCVPDFIQYATQTALKNSFHSVQILKNKMKVRHEYVSKALTNLKNITVYKSEGAFYIWMKLHNKALSSLQVAEALLNCGLAVVPGESFGCPYHLRLAVTLSDEDLDTAIGILRKYFS